MGLRGRSGRDKRSGRIVQRVIDDGARWRRGSGCRHCMGRSGGWSRLDLGGRLHWALYVRIRGCMGLEGITGGIGRQWLLKGSLVMQVTQITDNYLIGLNSDCVRLMIRSRPFRYGFSNSGRVAQHGHFLKRFAPGGGGVIGGKQ